MDPRTLLLLLWSDTFSSILVTRPGHFTRVWGGEFMLGIKWFNGDENWGGVWEGHLQALVDVLGRGVQPPLMVSLHAKFHFFSL